MPTPPAAALAAVLAGQTRVTRRCEIYESDGVTPWQPGMTPRITAGAVTVDYSRADRRNIDLTLDNKDGLISHNPDGGLWYDKIIKLFRGVKWDNVQKIPKIALWDYDGDIEAVRYIQRMGFKIEKRWPDSTPPTIDEIFDYDVLVMVRQGAPFDGAQITLAQQAFDIGISVFTISPYTNSGIPVVAAFTALTDSTGTSATHWSQSGESFGSPFTQFDRFDSTAKGAGALHYGLPTGIGAGAQAATLLDYTGTTLGLVHGYGLLYMQNPNSLAKWVHYAEPLYYHASVSSSDPVFQRYTRSRMALLNSAMYWLYDYDKDSEWECQIGEFMITQISTPRAPAIVSITGIDYQKKCLDSTFDEAVAFSPGENVLNLIRDFAANAGITKFRLGGPIVGSMGSTTSTSYAFDATSARWDAMAAIAEGANLEIFFDAQGYLVTRPFFDPSLSAPTLILKVGDPDGNLVDWSEISDPSLIYNRVVVSGVSTDSALTGALYQGIVENHEPSSPTSIERLGYTRTYYYSSPFFDSDQQCLDYARSMLAIHALENFQLSYTSIVFAWLEAGEIVQVDKGDSRPGDPTRFLNVNFAIPLTLDAMTGNAKRITIVGTPVQ